MLKRIRLIVGDLFWANILSSLGARVSDVGIKFAPPPAKLSKEELADYLDGLAAARLKELGAGGLSEAEQNLVLALPMAADELKTIAGYADESKTHTMETIIYNIRKKLGRDFIKFENGIYKL